MNQDQKYMEPNSSGRKDGGFVKLFLKFHSCHYSVIKRLYYIDIHGNNLGRFFWQPRIPKNQIYLLHNCNEPWKWEKSQRYFSQIDFAKGNYVNGRHFLKIVYCSFRRCRSSWNLKKDLMHSWADEFCTGCFNLRLYRSNDGRKRRILTSSIIQLSGSISSSRGDLEGRCFCLESSK